MQIYLCGGAVRDMLMNVVSNDNDYVVVGASTADMIDQGFKQVGADFPVFLHPVTGDEYALARREKKTGNGYLGFTSEFGVDVTLADDLKRRDITINSIAYDPDGHEKFIDPFNGQVDIENKVLRHTSNAFQEDPVRVLRIARFRARLGKEWRVADETKHLMGNMAKQGVLSELNGDRIWKEMSRAMMEPNPRLFFETLLECDCLHVIFPEVYQLITALESHRWHPEGNAFAHTMLVLDQAVGYTGTDEFMLALRMAALAHDFGKGITPRRLLPKHHGHDVNGVAVVKTFCDRIRVPAKIRDWCMKSCRYHMQGHNFDQLSGKGWTKMFDGMQIHNDPESVNILYHVFKCDARGRLGAETHDVSDKDFFLTQVEKYKAVKFANVFPNGESNVNKIIQGMYKARIQALGKSASD
jgi:tRNA nucleotidyltransferase (CCA-adding enzyme)